MAVILPDPRYQKGSCHVLDSEEGGGGKCSAISLSFNRVVTALRSFTLHAARNSERPNLGILEIQCHARFEPNPRKSHMQHLGHRPNDRHTFTGRGRLNGFSRLLLRDPKQRKRDHLIPMPGRPKWSRHLLPLWEPHGAVLHGLHSTARHHLHNQLHARPRIQYRSFKHTVRSAARRCVLLRSAGVLRVSMANVNSKLYRYSV